MGARQMKPVRALVTLFCVQGLAACLWTFFTPSEIRSGAFLWFSIPRLLLAILAFGAFLALVVLALYAWRSSRLADQISQTLDRWCVDEKQLGALLLPLIVVPVLASAGLWLVLRTPGEFSAYRAWAPDTFPLLQTVLRAILPLLGLLLISSLESAAYLGWRYRSRLKAAESWSRTRVSSSFILLLIVLTSARRVRPACRETRG